MKKLVLSFVASAALFGAACDLESSEDDTLEIIHNLVEAGFPESDIQLYDGLVYVGRDAHVTLEASREMIGIGPFFEREVRLEQYRTNNLVSLSIAEICIDGRRITNSVLSTGLDLAIENYNALSLSFTMRRTTGRGSGCDAVISARQDNSTGGVAGFPSRGLPYRRVTVGTGVAQFGADVAEHVFAHELGHTIGFRHSDWFNRSISCGVGGSEGTGSVGAIHIPGTPTGATVGGSVMNSCFRSTETGEFTSTDETALEVLY